MEIKHLLFDLDGDITADGSGRICKILYAAYGKSVSRRQESGSIKEIYRSSMEGCEAMVKNDGSQTNREAFWSYIDPCLPVSRKESRHLQMHFMTGSLTGQSVQRSRQSCQMQS